MLLDTTISSGGLIEVSQNGVVSDTTIAGGVLDLAAGGTSYGNLQGTASGTITFSGTGGALVLEDAPGMNATVMGFAPGDQIALVDAYPASVTLGSGNVLSASGNGQSFTFQLDPTHDYSHDTFNVSSGGVQHYFGDVADITISLPCYRSGSLIMTDRGEVAVQDLCIGDLAHTVLGETAAPIIWIGRREVDCTRHAKPRQVWPVRVAAGAFGPGQPHTDLFLSPDHAVYVNEVLIPIRRLVNASTIVQVPMERVTYYHIELPKHGVVLAQGLPAESFLDLKDGSNYPNRPGPVRLYPDYTARMWEAFGCARLIVTGPELTAARALVARFAAEQAAA
jgi:autotransporter passenger strand-loop-strand repeat protein